MIGAVSQHHLCFVKLTDVKRGGRQAGKFVPSLVHKSQSFFRLPSSLSPVSPKFSTSNSDLVETAQEPLPICYRAKCHPLNARLAPLNELVPFASDQQGVSLLGVIGTSKISRPTYDKNVSFLVTFSSSPDHGRRKVRGRREKAASGKRLLRLLCILQCPQ